MRVVLGVVGVVVIGFGALLAGALMLWLADPTNGEIPSEERRRLWGQSGGPQA